MGFTIGTATPPAWSEAFYPVAVGADETVYGFLRGCLTALNAVDGAQRWATRLPSGRLVMGELADSQVMLVAIGDSSSNRSAGVANFPVTDGFTALDPATGKILWTRDISADGQSIPAILARGVVLVVQADGTVDGLNARNGMPLWHARRPRTCKPSPRADSLDPVATMIPGVKVPLVAYNCVGAQQLIRFSPSTGAHVWHRILAKRAESLAVQNQGASASGVIGLMTFGDGHPIAPLKRGPDLTNGTVETIALAALDASTGRSLWEIRKVADSGSALAGRRRLCAVSAYAMSCYRARSGLRSWTSRQIATRAGDGGPELGNPGVIAAGGQIFKVVPTRAARRIPPQSTTYRSAPGTFRLASFDMATGTVTSSLRLPSWYGGRSQVVVSLESPPAVWAVTASRVFVTPEAFESDLIEAFDRRQ